MSTIINATTTNGVVIQPDNSGSLVLQTNNGTTALTISTAQDTTLAGKLTSAGALTLASNGTTTAITIDTSQRAAFVAGTAAAPAITTTGDTNTGMFFPAADTIAFAEGGAESMRIDSSGNVLVGTTTQSDTAKVTVKQTAGGSNYGISFVDNSSNPAWIGSGGGPGLYFRAGTGNPAGALNSSGNFIDASDIAYKENIEPIQYGLDIIVNLKPKKYSLKANGIKAIGFIAQDIEKIIPELVSGEEGSKGISYGQLTAVLVKAIQEQQIIINDLKARVEALEVK
jgi:hypothetical protein